MTEEIRMALCVAFTFIAFFAAVGCIVIVCDPNKPDPNRGKK